MKIGVFDSGIGGLSVANAIKKALPDLEVVLREDKENVPYGTKSPELLLTLVTPILQELVEQGCQVIVIACNTVTTTIIGQIRQKFNIPFVAIEPMLKPASEITKTGVVAVCATPTTISSPRYRWLKDTYLSGKTVLEPDCSDWSYLIENNKIDQMKIDERINEVLQKNADVIVLGCTHYHWIEQEIKELSKDKAIVLQPEQAIIEQLKRVIAQLV
jgi:glutamate racemase